MAFPPGLVQSHLAVLVQSPALRAGSNAPGGAGSIALFAGWFKRPRCGLVQSHLAVLV